MDQELKIACPKCSWEPDGGAYWACTKCGCSWNTFDTRGKCPSCGKQYHNTQCIGYRGGCDKMSPHLDWYTDLSNVVDELLKSIEEPVFQ